MNTKRIICLLLTALLALTPLLALAEEGAGDPLPPNADPNPSADPAEDSAPSPGQDDPEPSPGQDDPAPSPGQNDPDPTSSADPGPTPSPTPRPGGASATELVIDTAYIYPGMTKSYADGYMPTVSRNQAVFVLPLLGDAMGDMVRVTPEISTSDSIRNC